MARPATSLRGRAEPATARERALVARAVVARPVVARRLCVLLLAAAGAAMLGGCWLHEPRLPHFDPPPIVEPETLLLAVPKRAVDALASRAVVEDLDLELSGHGASIGVQLLPEGRHARIGAHEVVAGMSVREVIWCFLSHPTRGRDQGPPGGHTLIWEPPGWGHARYWVRFDENGLASAAGRY